MQEYHNFSYIVNSHIVKIPLARTLVRHDTAAAQMATAVVIIVFA